MAFEGFLIGISVRDTLARRRISCFRDCILFDHDNISRAIDITNLFVELVGDAARLRSLDLLRHLLENLN